jgi:hypothetical protein
LENHLAPPDHAEFTARDALDGRGIVAQLSHLDA